MSRREKQVKKDKIRRKIRWRHIDKNFVQFISKRRMKYLTGFMKLMTRIGDGVVWVVLCVVFLLLNSLIPGMAYTGIAMAFALVAQVSLQSVIKHIFGRKRPYVAFEEISNVIAPPDRFSFPSGHTAGAFALAFVFYYFVPVLFVPMVILSSLIGFSRIYLGLHYPSDVLAGIVLGLISAIIGINLTIILPI